VISSDGIASRLENPRLHHVAVVVADLDEALARYRTLGFSGSERFVLVEPEGSIARFLAKRGEGVHHVAYAVPDLIAALKGLEAAGIRLIDAAPRTGAHGWRIAFVHPESCGGVLTELVQEQG
jgi:methylmalonyl-CoA/ethylmalonyl-CoA epimerase